MYYMENLTHPTPPQEKEVKDYKKRLFISTKTIQKVKRSGYDPEEAIEYFAQLMKEKNELENKYKQQEDLIKNALENITKMTAAYHSETIKNNRLRAAIVALHKENYWEILNNAQKGRYNE